ncbi:ATP-binding protein [Frankia sp. CiP3]|uniref:ATP-binding protein n=1 Tax=Frankia sp. CiP3 TaxID=2880971 RepID=UPI001EF4195B|nr:AAA family ATPase [Frankia sp. CiP3]
METGDQAAGGSFASLLRQNTGAIRVDGVPTDAGEGDAAVLRSALIMAAENFTKATGADDLALVVTNRRVPVGGESAPEDEPDVLSIEKRASYFRVSEPLYGMDFLVLPDKTMEELRVAVDAVVLRTRVFDQWNLRSIQPHPGSAVNFHGGPGTGKTLAAHAIAHSLGKKILESKTSQLESKYHGEGPKNLDALFRAATANDAVLFIDEADSLMSQRFEHTSQGSEQAVNTMRSELLMALDRYDGLVIFATNLVTSYDPAFDSRLRHVRFPEPDARARAEIWRRHLPAEMPVDPDVDVTWLAEVEVSGREIRRAVVDAAVRVARSGRARVTAADLRHAVESVRGSRIVRPAPAVRPISASDMTH